MSKKNAVGASQIKEEVEKEKKEGQGGVDDEKSEKENVTSSDKDAESEADTTDGGAPNFLDKEERIKEIEELRSEILTGKPVKGQETESTAEDLLEVYTSLPRKAVQILDELPPDERKKKWQDALEELPEAKDKLDQDAIDSWKTQAERKRIASKRERAARDPVSNAARGEVDLVIEALQNTGQNLALQQQLANDSLITAAEFGRNEVIKALLQRKNDFQVDVNAKSNMDARTALIVATVGGNDEGVALLLQNGANVEVTDDDGYSALHHAVLKDSITIATALVKAGADPCAPSKSGKAAKDFARAYSAINQLWSQGDNARPAKSKKHSSESDSSDDDSSDEEDEQEGETVTSAEGEQQQRLPQEKEGEEQEHPANPTKEKGQEAKTAQDNVSSSLDTGTTTEMDSLSSVDSSEEEN